MTRKKLDMILEEIWQVYDSDRSGYLEINEIEQMLSDIFTQTNKKISSDQMKIILSIIDQDGDGRVEKNELKTLLLS